MKIAFILTMPNVGSWNGKWSGEGNLYCIVKSFTSKKGKEKAVNVLSKPSYYYRWNDGWCASVAVKKVENAEARTLKRNSKGFCGYDWMIDSIIENGLIKT
jgi:hypothetical protein